MMNKKQLYESIIASIAKEVKRALNEEISDKADNDKMDNDTKQKINNLLQSWKEAMDKRAQPAFLEACKRAQQINKDWLFDIFDDNNKVNNFINNIQEYFQKINNLKLLEGTGFRCVDINSVQNVYKVLFELSKCNKIVYDNINNADNKTIIEICKFYNDKIEPYIKQIQHYIDTVLAYKNMRPRF